jgi:hypothetical protein
MASPVPLWVVGGFGPPGSCSSTSTKEKRKKKKKKIDTSSINI